MRAQIQWSARVQSPSPPSPLPSREGGAGGGVRVEIALITNLPAFHNLLAKLRLASTFLSERFMSLPGVEPTSNVNRNASVPKSSMTINGSITLPYVFDILRPCSSRIRPCKYTV